MVSKCYEIVQLLSTYLCIVKLIVDVLMSNVCSVIASSVKTQKIILDPIGKNSLLVSDTVQEQDDIWPRDSIVQLLTHEVHILRGDGGGVPDDDRGGGVIQRQSVRICTTQAGTVVSDETPRQKTDYKSWKIILCSELMLIGNITEVKKVITFCNLINY